MRRQRLPALQIGLALTLQGASALAANAAGAPEPGTPWAVQMPDAAAAPAPPKATPQALGEGPWSLAELTAFALAHNPATQAAWAAAMVDGAGVEAARALLRPTLGLSTTLSLDRTTGAAPAAGADPGSAPSVTRSLSPSLGLSWVLFDFGARASGVEAARWQAAASQLAYNRNLQEVVYTVEQGYYSLLGAQQLLAAFQLGVEAAQASLDSVQARRSAGLATVGEAAQAEASLAEARLQLVRGRASVRSAQGTLAVALGLPVTVSLELAEQAAGQPGPAQPGLPPGSPDVDALLALAHTSRADLAAASALVKQGEAQLAATRAQGQPVLALSASVGRTWSSAESPVGRQQLSIGLSLPIFDGGLVRAQTQAAQARLLQLRAERDQQRQSVALEVWQSFQSADSAQAVIASAEASLRSASLAETAARERYGAGVGSLLELLVTQSSTAQARVSVVQARYDGFLAVAQLGYSVGRRVPGAPTASDSSSFIP